jgi:hypothetical protein
MASLVTHLLAVRDDAAQYREKRRAAPSVAVAGYGARVSTPVGLLADRSV